MNYQKKLKEYQQKDNQKVRQISLVLLMKQNIFSLQIFQNHLLFISTKKCIRYFSGTSWIESWKLNGISEESIKNITKSYSNFCAIFCRPSLITREEF